MLNKAEPLLPVSIVETPSIEMLLDMQLWVPCATVPVTPGASDATLVKPRFWKGKFWMDSVGTVNDRSPLVAWIKGSSALTSTVSVVPPIDRTMVPSDAVTPGLTETPDCFAVLKEGIVISTV